MKAPLPLRLAACLCLAACGGSDDDSPSAPAPPTPPPGEQKAGRTPGGDAPNQSRKVTVREVTNEALLERVEVMKKLTAELKPLVTPERDPEGALAKEAALKELFDEYDRLAKFAEEDGLTPFEIAGYTARLSDEWRDVYKEFTQYQQLVGLLGKPQREMLNRLMGIEGPDPATHVQEHLENLERGLPP